jgi:K+-transporting ATPase ATPase B chain
MAKEKYNIRGRKMAPVDARFIAFSAQTRLPAVDISRSAIRRGAVDAVLAFARNGEGDGEAGDCGARADPYSKSDEIARSGGTPLAVCRMAACSA